MADPFASFLSTRRGTSAPPDEEPESSFDDTPEDSPLRDLKGTIFDDADPIANWRKWDATKSHPERLPAATRAIGNTMDWLSTPIQAAKQPLDWMREKSLDWATAPGTSTAGRYLKAFPGAVADTLGGMASPLGIASFIPSGGTAGAVGAGARAMLAGEQMATGKRQIDEAQSPWDVAKGAGTMALGGALVHGDLASGGGLDFGLTEPKGMGQVDVNPTTDIGPRRVRRYPDGYEPPPGTDVYDMGATPDLDRLLNEAPDPRALPPPGLPPYEGPEPRFAGGSEGMVDLAKDYPNDPFAGFLEASRKKPAGLLPERAGEGDLGIPAGDSNARPFTDSNRPITPQEYLSGANLRGGPSLAPDLEAMLGSEGVVKEGQPGLQDFDVVDAFGPNASGESGASQEAINRLQGMKGRGEQFGVYDRSGNFRPLVGADAVDYAAKNGETFGIRDQNGFRVLDDKGGIVRPEGSANGLQESPSAEVSSQQGTGAEARTGEGPETYDIGGTGEPIDLERELKAIYGDGDSVRPAAGPLDAGAPPELRPTDAGGVDEGRGAGDGALSRRVRVDPEDLAGDPNGLAFRRKSPEENAKRFTPEVRRELERIRDELETFSYTDRTWTPVRDKSGNGAGGDYDIAPGSGGAPVYDDIRGEAPLGRPRGGKIARSVGGSRGRVRQAVQQALESGDIPDNLAEGAVRVAERRAAGDWKGLSKPWLPPSWETPRAIDDIPPELSDAIDALAKDDSKYAALEELLGKSNGDEQVHNITRHAAYGNGQVLPEGQLPTELRGLEQLFDNEDWFNDASPHRIEGAPDPKQNISDLADILDTGEAQPRLPEAGQVRNQDIATPEVGEAPFSLNAPKNTGTDALEQSLFGEGVPRETAPTESTRGNVNNDGLESLLGGSKEPLSVQSPASIPLNVRHYLERQLKYTSEQVDAMSAGEATRIGREQIANPNPPETPKAAREVQPLQERSTIPDADQADALRRARGLQRREQLQRSAVAPSEPQASDGGPMPRTAAERQAAGEPLTAAERKQLGLPEETRPREPVSLREQGNSPRQLQQRVQRLDKWMGDPTPENFARWVDEVTGQAERFNRKQLKGGTGEEGAPPRADSGEYFASGAFPGAQVFANPALLKKLGSFLVSNEPVDRLLRGVIGAGVGAITDQDNRLRGAVYGAVTGMVGPQVARAVANDFVLLVKGQVPKGLAEVYAKKARTGDIGVIENIFGTKARTIPDEFAAVRPGIEALQRVKETGKVDSRAPLFDQRFGDEGAPAYKNGKLQIKTEQFLKPEIGYLRKQAKAASEKGRPRLASYLDAFAEELAGTMTRSEKFLQENLGLSRRAAGRISTEGANQIYRAGLAFNPGSAVVNRVAQPLLAAPFTGLRNLWKAYAPLSESEKLLSKIERPIDIADVGKAGWTVLNKFDEVASSLMRFTDNQNRQGVAAAAKLAADQAGAAPDVAQKFARDVSEKTQGLLGLLSGNPRWRGPAIKMFKPFTKYPILFAEWLNDVATHPDPRVRWRTAAMAGGVMALSQATGIDGWDMLSGGARWGGSAIIRAAMDVYAHANSQVKDHTMFSMPGKGFADSDVGSLAYPVGIRKVVETGSRFYRQGLGPHKRRTPGGAVDEVSASEDALNLFGVKTTRQTARQDLLNSAHEDNTRAAAAESQASAQAKRDYLAAYDSGDEAGMQDALSRMSSATRKNVVKTRDRDRFDRLLHATPVKRRPDTRSKYGDLEQALELPQQP